MHEPRLLQLVAQANILNLLMISYYLRSLIICLRSCLSFVPYLQEYKHTYAMNSPASH